MNGHQLNPYSYAAEAAAAAAAVWANRLDQNPFPSNKWKTGKHFLNPFHFRFLPASFLFTQSKAHWIVCFTLLPLQAESCVDSPNYEHDFYGQLDAYAFSILLFMADSRRTFCQAIVTYQTGSVLFAFHFHTITMATHFHARSFSIQIVFLLFTK
jgi:hypothetical protein